MPSPAPVVVQTFPAPSLPMTPQGLYGHVHAMAWGMELAFMGALAGIIVLTLLVRSFIKS